MTTETRRPYRIQVFATGLTAGKRHKRFTQLVVWEYGYDAWNPEQSYQEARLPSAGSFLYPGIFAVRQAAMEFLARPETRQVAIRTNQDKRVYTYNKHDDGRITGYLA